MFGAKKKKKSIQHHAGERVLLDTPDFQVGQLEGGILGMHTNHGDRTFNTFQYSF